MPFAFHDGNFVSDYPSFLTGRLKGWEQHMVRTPEGNRQCMVRTPKGVETVYG